MHLECIFFLVKLLFFLQLVIVTILVFHVLITNPCLTLWQLQNSSQYKQTHQLTHKSCPRPPQGSVASEAPSPLAPAWTMCSLGLLYSCHLGLFNHHHSGSSLIFLLYWVRFSESHVFFFMGLFPHFDGTCFPINCSERLHER